MPSPCMEGRRETGGSYHADPIAVAHEPLRSTLLDVRRQAVPVVLTTSEEVDRWLKGRSGDAVPTPDEVGSLRSIVDTSPQRITLPKANRADHTQKGESDGG